MRGLPMWQGGGGGRSSAAEADVAAAGGGGNALGPALGPWVSVAGLFDAIGYGLALVGERGRLTVANAAAVQTLRRFGWIEDEHAGCKLSPRLPADAERLQRAFSAAALGRSSLLYFGGPTAADDDPRLSTANQRARRLRARAAAAEAQTSEFGVAIVPLRDARPGTMGSEPNVAATACQPMCALVFARSSLSHPAAVAFFAREYGLTQSEEGVLRAMCNGLRPQDIARELDIAVSTVRSHLRSLCQKTASHGQVELMRRLALLPPLSMFDRGGWGRQAGAGSHWMQGADAALPSARWAQGC